jgi:hypothetical protein
MLSQAGELAGSLAIVTLAGRLFLGPRRKTPWSAELLQDQESCGVDLAEGAFSGQRVHLPGMPALGARLTRNPGGPVPKSLRDVHYVVTKVWATDRLALATWTRN